MRFRVLVTGSRGWQDVAHIHGVLDAQCQAAHAAGYDGLTLVHGAARGLDEMAGAWARIRAGWGWPVVEEAHPADWKRHNRAAGFKRNSHMVSLGAEVCFAWILNGSRGATQCADLAEKAGIHVERFAVRTDAAILPDPDGE